MSVLTPSRTTHIVDGRFCSCVVDNVTCGSVGIRMAVGDTVTGGRTSFGGQTLTVAAGDFHESVRHADHTYRLDLLDDTGVVLSQEIPCDTTTYLALETKNVKFYRAEIRDVTKNLRIAVGNPIWNSDE